MMQVMRTIVFGAGGLLGRHLVAALPGLGFPVVAAPRGRAEADIADPDVVASLFEAHRPQAVFNAAAYTDVDGAEDDPSESGRCFRANVLGPAVLAAESARGGCRFVHYSTDFVFDGESPVPYDEDAPPSPQGTYARSKVEGERRVLAAHPGAQVVRVGCLYGRGGRNFPSVMLERLRTGQAIRADDERRVSPTWVGELATFSARLASRSEARGLFHATASGETTWATFAQRMAALAGLPSTVEAVRGTTLALKAPRPRRSILISRRLPALGLSPLPDWTKLLHAYLGAEGVPGHAPA